MYLPLPFLQHGDSPFLCCKCIANKINQGVLSFIKGQKIEIARFKTDCLSALTDGLQTFIIKKDGFTPEFEEGVSSVLQKHTLPNTYGQMYCWHRNPEI